MKWLTLEQIRKHLRIDDDMTLEDDLLESYGESAEDAVLALLCRSYVNVLLTFGKIPKQVVHASLLLVDLSYKERSAVSSVHLSMVPYSLDLLLKPFMRLSGCSGGDDEKPSGMLADCYGVFLVGGEGVLLCSRILTK